MSDSSDSGRRPSSEPTSEADLCTTLSQGDPTKVRALIAAGARVRYKRMDRLEARGEAPGWIYQHRAATVGSHRIRVWGGTVITGYGSEESNEPNVGSFVLDLDGLVWRRE
jgi:hypothetical protein